MAVVAGAGSTATVTARDEEKTLHEELSLLVLLADRLIKSAQEAESSKQDCSELAKQVDRLSQVMRSAVRFSAASPSLYDRPLRRIATDVAKNLDRAVTLVRKCKHSGVLRQVFSITTTADFRKVSSLLESSIGDMKWLLSVFDSDGNLSLPPIASNDPILAWVWTYISTIQMSQTAKNRTDAAIELASIARDNERNKKMIAEEGGITPLLKLLKDGPSPEAQIAAVNALINIATDQQRVQLIVESLGVPIIVGVLGDSPMKVQIALANLVAVMAELDSRAQEEFVTENVTRRLVSLLSIDLVLDTAINDNNNRSIHSLVEMKRESSLNNSRFSISEGSSHGNSQRRKEREMEPPDVKIKLKISCAEALWKLSRGSLSTSKKITETKGLLCLAKLIEKEKGELQYNCLMTVLEITAVAESNTELRRAAFKTNWPPAMAILDQLLRVIKEEDDTNMQIAAIRSIGCLARTFPAKETRIIENLVGKLGDRNVKVATEAAIALGKFVSPENFNCSLHSRAVIEFDGVPHLMKLVRNGDAAGQMYGLILLCYLALNAGNSKALEQAKALNAIEGAARPVISQHPELRELIGKAIHHLTLYQVGPHSQHRHPFAA